MRLFTGIIMLFLFLASSSLAANYPFALHAVEGDGLSVRELGVKQIRVAALMWDDMEPVKGNYDFSETDRGISSLQGQNVRLIVATIRAINMWGGNKKAQRGYKRGVPLSANSGFPSDIEAWKKFIHAIVERYDGDGVEDMPGLRYPIKHWQIEGEWMWQWKDTTPNYLKFLNITYKEIKKADPSAKVIAGAITGSIAFSVGVGFDNRGYFEKDNGYGGTLKVTRGQLLQSKDFWKALYKANYLIGYGKNSYDILDIHLYSKDAYSIPPAMEWLKFTMMNYGYSKPVWSLENAGPFYEYSENIHAREIVKRYLLSISSGIDKIFWSSLHITQGWDEKYKRLSLLDEYDRRKAAFFTYKHLLSKIDGFDKIERLNMGDGIYAFKVKKRKAVSYILWSDKGLEARLFTRSTKIIVTDTVSLKKRILRIKGGLFKIKLWGEPIIVEEL